jgi:NitT/TauT family transport system substrate-binding protein
VNHRNSSRPTHLARLAATLSTAIVVAAALAACSSGTTASTSNQGGSGKTTTVSYGITSRSLSEAPVMIAQEKGYFADEGIKFDEVLVGQSGKVCQQLIAKALDMGECSTGDVVQAIANNGPISVDFFTSGSALPNTVYASKSVSSWADLKGKTVMVGGPRDNTLYFFNLMAKANGLNPKSVTFQYSGSSTDRYAALKSGAIAATILTAPMSSQAGADGFTKLGDLSDYVPAKSYGGNGVVTRTDWAKANSGTLQKVYNALEKAIAYGLDPANKQEVISIMASGAGVSHDFATQAYQSMWASGYFVKDSEIKTSGISGIIASLKSLGYLNGAKVPATSTIYTPSAIKK